MHTTSPRCTFLIHVCGLDQASIYKLIEVTFSSPKETLLAFFLSTLDKTFSYPLPYQLKLLNLIVFWKYA
jgi:hypothetical protein